jgi:mono/diheme cytochrome c family protein
MTPSLVNTTFVMGPKPKLIHIVLKGMSGGVSVDGDDYNGRMPALSELSDQDVADVLTYVRSHFGNKASAVTPAEVTRARGR